MSTCSEWFRDVFRKGKLQAPNALQCAALPAFGLASEAAGWVSTQTSCLEKQHVTFDQHIRHWNSWTFRRVPSCFSSGTWSSGRFLMFFGNLELLDIGFAWPCTFSSSCMRCHFSGQRQDFTRGLPGWCAYAFAR